MKKLVVLLIFLCLLLAACEKEPLPTETDPRVTLPTATAWQTEAAPVPTGTEPAPTGTPSEGETEGETNPAPSGEPTAPTPSDSAPDPVPSESESFPAPSESGSAPAPSASETDPAPTDPADAEAVPVLSGSRTALYGKVDGPAGTVTAVGVQGGACQDPVYGDVDGDGQRELLFHSGYKDDGQRYEVVSVYGLEAGWPICEAWVYLCVGEGRLQLAETSEGVSCLYTPKGGVDTLIPLTVEDDRVVLNGGGSLPEGFTVKDRDPFPNGGSFRKLSEQVGSKALSSQPGCLVWREPGVYYTRDDILEGYQSYVYVLVSDNGVTDTNFFVWVETADGRLVYGGSEHTDPITAPEDPNEYLGLTEAELTARLGPWHFRKPVSETGEDLDVLCWVTQDGRLLTVQLMTKVVGATLTELLPKK